MKHMLNPIKTTQNAVSRHLGRFRKDDEGAMIIFSLILFVLILTFGGMAVDLMRFETTRAKLQATLDRATLAAADLDQTEAPADIVIDYFTKAGMIDFLDGDPIVEEGINYRVVTANAKVDMPLFFFDLPNVFLTPFNAGLSTFTVVGASTAEERVTDVEVSLILDVSGSMSRNERIENLRPAARTFVSTVLANNTNAPNGLITISIVPYSAVVNPGQDIINTGNLLIDRTHHYSTCPLFENDALFETTELDLDFAYPHVAHFDPDWYSSDAEPIGNPWCHDHENDMNAIVPLSTDEDLLHDAIDALEPYGNTAIDMGMKWGVALLDPSTQAIVTALAADSDSSVPAIADGRPQAHDQGDIAKVIVLMTDGSNTQQYDLYDRFKNNMSYIWFDLDNYQTDYEDMNLEDVHRSYISVQYDGLRTPYYYEDDRFYVGTNSNSTRFRTYPQGFSSNAEYVAAREAGSILTTVEGMGNRYTNNVHQASWQELFATWEYNRVNNDLLSRAKSHGAIPNSAGTAWARDEYGNYLYDAYGDPIVIYYADYNDADSSIDYDIVDSGEADDRLSDICEAARDQGIIIYTVAFEAPYGGQTALSDCASSPSHYFDVDGADITDAFSSIASDIRALKLTQ
ncbi:pilus assembly protein [Octadecabacter sp. 1_MG-2023]|uniref:TadE/TadG family type IV pilus assembly protein n=1 Tax=unclassified Octadecabacter TaxID=196158 RepID=UPI001C0904A1|nr:MULTISPECIES: TadE/TadG family type IV pilus assembly protein [unclassified Octadecabacter]MBU2993932.1 pilus assembly protein [Octadecabacter sp. B2R22]MDO6735222.1 pilus assembly protein [Octadecabacter sp. 1_MG-2023]